MSLPPNRSAAPLQRRSSKRWPTALSDEPPPPNESARSTGSTASRSRDHGSARRQSGVARRSPALNEAIHAHPTSRAAICSRVSTLSASLQKQKGDRHRIDDKRPNTTAATVEADIKSASCNAQQGDPKRAKATDRRGHSKLQQRDARCRHAQPVATTGVGRTRLAHWLEAPAR